MTAGARPKDRKARQRKPARITRREIEQALKAAKAAGFKVCEFTIGEIRMVFSDGVAVASSAGTPLDDWMAKRARAA
jgi:hypothetical protein